MIAELGALWQALAPHVAGPPVRQKLAELTGVMATPEGSP